MGESTVKAIFHKRGIVRILKILIHKRICDFDNGLRTLYKIRPIKLKAIRPGNLKEKFDIEKMELDSQRGNNLNANEENKWDRQEGLLKRKKKWCMSKSREYISDPLGKPKGIQ